MSDDVEPLRRVCELFNRREIERVLAVMHPDVIWANGWKVATATGPMRCAAIGNVNGRSSIRMSSPSRSRQTARGNWLSKFIRLYMTQGKSPGRQTGDARLPDTKRAHPAFRHPRCIVGRQNRIMRPCRYVWSGVSAIGELEL